MSKKLAIKGHPTRGKEVIELLEMMGEYCPAEIYGLCENRCYFIKDNGWVGWDYIGPEKINKYEIFTLEEFLEKYPFKVGDKVIDDSGEDGIIIKMKWDEEILYKVDFGEECYYFTSDYLRPYEETNIKLNKCTHCVYAVNNNHCGLRGFRSNFNVNYCSAQNTDKLPNGFELQEDGYFSWVNKKPKYPTTYEECCKILDIRWEKNYTQGYKCGLINKFQELFICCNTYWKIAGEEMELGKPWEPSWQKTEERKFCIIRRNDNVVTKWETKTIVRFLAFPTAEMRDAFYENFKDLIESCKELL